MIKQPEILSWKQDSKGSRCSFPCRRLCKTSKDVPRQKNIYLSHNNRRTSLANQSPDPSCPKRRILGRMSSPKPRATILSQLLGIRSRPFLSTTSCQTKTSSLSSARSKRRRNKRWTKNSKVNPDHGKIT